MTDTRHADNCACALCFSEMVGAFSRMADVVKRFRQEIEQGEDNNNE